MLEWLKNAYFWRMYMLKRMLATFVLLCLLPVLVLAEGAPAVVDLVNHPEAEWAFEEGADILEIFFPPVRGADCCILRFDGKTLMVDAATPGQHDRVAAALAWAGINHIDTGFNTHPHDDHIGGFDILYQAAAMDELIITFPADFNNNMKRTMRAMEEQNIPVRTADDGDLIPFGDVRLEVIRRDIGWFSENDCSAMIRLDYGERSLLLTADVDRDGQNNLLETAPEKLDVDIFKYPHHGVRPAGWNFIKHMSPELTVITNNRFNQNVKEVRKDAQKRGITPICTSEGMVRLRTDGHIWVVDQIKLDVE